MKTESLFRPSRSLIGSLSSLLTVLFVASSFAQARNEHQATQMPQKAARQTKPGTAFTVTGAVDKPGEWTSERLTTEFAAEIKTVHYVLKGNPGEARCVPLLTVLKAAAPRLNPKAKNHLLAFTVFVRAVDGYTVSFGWGELQPDVGKREVWLALDRNGKAIPGDDGPVELIVPGDAKPSRWVHGVSQIVVTDGIALTEQAGK